ncbi:MAG: carbohydrate binding family 9 domain-containing protein, partial [Gemmatimonadetes bacterium]|nr:carbohydrate binding family 9 domain-containing protein [Gemmatimonadota bacterium]
MYRIRSQSPPWCVRIALAVLACAPAPLFAQTDGGGDRGLTRSVVPLPLARLDGPIELDGVPDEPAWAAIAPLPLFMWAPRHGDALTEETDVRVGYDDRYLYMSGRMYDSDPDGIRSNTFYRDQFSGDDLLSIMIDSYNDYETAVWFVTNPAGARSDRTMSNDAEFGGGGFPMNADWNSHWDVATHRTEEGWFAEFRIPFSTLGFQSDGGEVTMGIIVYRFIARKNERQLFPFIDEEWGGFGFGKPSQAQRVILRNVRPTKPIYITPYLLGGLTQTPELRTPLDGSPAAWTTEGDPTSEPGLDLKYSPSSNLAFDLTLNTDFAQVEADDQQINLTRFPLFFPEKRQFFQERASTFDFGTGGFTDRLFFSRR